MQAATSNSGPGSGAGSCGGCSGGGGGNSLLVASVAIIKGGAKLGGGLTGEVDDKLCLQATSAECGKSVLDDVDMAQAGDTDGSVLSAGLIPHRPLAGVVAKSLPQLSMLWP